MGDNDFDGGRYPEWLNDVAKKVDELIMQPPILQRFRQQVLDWAETRSRKLEAIHSWEEAREAHRFRILTDAQLQNEEADPPEPGWEFEFYPKWGAYAKACRVVDRKEIEVRYTVNEGISGWTPPDLLQSACPEYEPPLPLPKRNLSISDKYTAMAAIHDAIYKGVTLVNPWLVDTSPGDEAGARRFHAVAHAYTDLLAEVKCLASSEQVSIQAVLRNVEADLTTGGLTECSEVTRTTATKRVVSPRASQTSTGVDAADDVSIAVGKGNVEADAPAVKAGTPLIRLSRVAELVGKDKGTIARTMKACDDAPKPAIQPGTSGKANLFLRSEMRTWAISQYGIDIGATEKEKR